MLMLLFLDGIYVMINIQNELDFVVVCT